MNWEALQATAEIIAALGVIISLLYLAAQVRQNTRSVQAAANQDLLTGYRSIIGFSAESSFGARLCQATLRGSWDELSPEEQSAGRQVWIAILRLYEHAYMQHRAGMLGDDAWAGWAYQIRLAVGLGGCQGVWPAISGMLNESFVAWVNGFGDEPARIVAQYTQRILDAGLEAATFDSAGEPSAAS